jgi:hypothetical protein
MIFRYKIVFLGIAGGLCVSACAPSIPDEDRLMMAHQIVRSMKEIYIENPEFVSVSVSDFDLLDQDYYRNALLVLERKKFQFLGDMENRSISRSNPALKTCIRTFIGDEGSVGVAVYQIRKSHQLPDGMKAMECETEFSNGHFLNTNNNRTEMTASSPPEFHVKSLSTSVFPELLSVHRKRVQEYLSETPGVQSRRIRLFNDMVAQQQRLAVLQWDHRRKIQGLTEKELRAAAAHLSRKDKALLLEDIHRIYAESDKINK